MKCEPISLNAALIRIASHLKLDPVELAEYAKEDTIGGYHADESQRQWPVGSLWAVEGQILYALVRALKPKLCLELGTYHGCSATHIASAIKRNDNGGWLVCVDNGHDAPHAPAIGHLIPDSVRDVIELVDKDIVEYVKSAAGWVGFIYEDGFHSLEQVEAVWHEIQRLLIPGGVAVSHDSCHFIVGDNVSEGIRRAGVMDAAHHLVSPSDCGLAIWRKPYGDFGVLPAEIHSEADKSLQAVDEAIYSAPSEEKPKRKRKAKA